ncbi:CRAL TRIO domain containing protein [Musa troglodytarum]|uniref:CRAL TRIO domain containing protein n=1 Tax=Musa troglodytarum TaxID=320322 RepID=A0A9E7GUU7_9LILI|nr:CRAL TRIO domain containing protein [Musa troglodytarum]
MVNMLPNLCSDASVSRYLRARNWNVEKASKMLKESLKWRLEYKPETIRWDDVAHEAETGKIYRADYLDKNGRAVLVMRPGFQNTSSSKGQIRYLVYCMENAIFNLAANQEQMVWLIDFQGWTMGSVSIKVTRETAHILQDYYPERLALGILYNPPRIFESFWKVCL